MEVVPYAKQQYGCACAGRVFDPASLWLPSTSSVAARGTGTSVTGPFRDHKAIPRWKLSCKLSTPLMHCGVMSKAEQDAFHATMEMNRVSTPQVDTLANARAQFAVLMAAKKGERA